MLATAAATNESAQQRQAGIDNLLSEVRGAAFTEATIAAFQTLNNGGNQSEARAAAREAINEYYSRIVANILRQFELEVEQSRYIKGVEADLADFEGNDTRPGWIAPALVGSGSDLGGHDVRTFEGDPFPEATITLPNNETMTITTYSLSSNQVAVPRTSTASSVGTLTNGTAMLVVGPNGTRTQLAPTGPYADLLNRVDAQRENVDTEVSDVVNSTYDEWDQDQLNITDVLSPREIATESQFNYNETPYAGFAAAQLSQLGAGNVTMAHTVETPNETLEGTLFYVGADDSPTTLETGETYAPAEYNGSFIMATDEGQRHLTERFQLVEQRDYRTGESVDSVEVADTNPEETNTSGFDKTIDRLKESRDRARSSAAGGGSGSDGGGLFDFPTLFDGFEIPDWFDLPSWWPLAVVGTGLIGFLVNVALILGLAVVAGRIAKSVAESVRDAGSELIDSDELWNLILTVIVMVIAASSAPLTATLSVPIGGYIILAIWGIDPTEIIS